MDEREVVVGREDGGVEEDEPDVYPQGGLVVGEGDVSMLNTEGSLYALSSWRNRRDEKGAELTMPSLSLLTPSSRILYLVASSAPAKSPSGGPSRISCCIDRLVWASGGFLNPDRLAPGTTTTTAAAGPLPTDASLFARSRVRCGETTRAAAGPCAPLTSRFTGDMFLGASCWWGC